MNMTQTISTKRLRDDLAEILEQVAIGRQEFIVAKFGKQKARIVPIENDISSSLPASFASLDIAGIWADRKDMKDSAKWVSENRKKESLRNTF